MKDNHQYTDTEAIDEILAGNSALFELIIRRYNTPLYKVGRSYGFNHEDTQDLMQETFISSYVKLRQFEGRSSLKTWLVRIMLNHCYHKSHKHSHIMEVQGIPSDNYNPNHMTAKNDAGDTGRSVINRELNRVIESSLENLSEDHRMTFALRELTGLSVEETAAVMKTTQSNVKVRLNRAKIMLRKEIEKAYTLEDIYEFNLVYCNKIVENVMKKVTELAIE